MLVSDNAGCYQNSMLLLLVPYLSYAHGIRVSRIIHTETQDGKSVLDALPERLKPNTGGKGATNKPCANLNLLMLISE